MQAYTHLIFDIDARGVVSVTLNRPEVHNAFNAELIGEITQAFERIENDPSVRFAVLSGNGPSFCAGGDLNWMRAMKGYSEEENQKDSVHLAQMFAHVRTLSVPLIGIVHGNALGGGSGLTAACDYVVASEDATFGFPEVRIGLTPATIAPFVMEKIGTSAALAHFLRGAPFTADTAKSIGLVHEVVPNEQLAQEREKIIKEFLKCGPLALRKTKALVSDVLRLSKQENAATLTGYTVQTIASIRVSDEGQEGMAALLEKRKAAWIPQ